MADVIVVGGGMGGLVAAISAAQNGASVILLEKLAVLGGSTNYGGGLSVAGSRFHLEQEGTWITHDELYAGWVNLQLYDPQQLGFYDPELIRAMVDNSGERFNWLMDLGYEPSVHAGGRMLVPTRPEDFVGTWTGSLLVEFLEQAALNAGVEIQRNMRGMHLIQAADGSITGVIAQGIAGEIEFTANNSVILATGGFSRNQEMMERFIPQLAPFVQYTMAAIGHMGDGMRMAEEVGAVPYEDQWLIGLGLSNSFAGMVMGHIPGILVNHEGMRYVMETRPPGFIDHYTFIYNYTINYSPDGAFFVFDSSEPFEMRVGQVEANLDHPDAFKGETIEELAAAMGVPADNLQTEIDHINAVAAGTVEDRLGRTVAVNEISEGPFYAIRFFPMDMGTIGGVVVNEYYQVLDADGNIIPGLFAVGEVSNRRYIAPMYFSGLSLMLTLQHGIVAGEAAAR
jgi:fumarate reductase flavoprotein subunit